MGQEPSQEASTEYRRALSDCGAHERTDEMILFSSFERSAHLIVGTAFETYDASMDHIEDHCNSKTASRQARHAGVVLCGGQSSRMGRCKADLEFGDETMLQRVVRLLSSAVDHIVVVASVHQDVPDFGSSQCSVSVARDELRYAGPLAGMSVGLNHLRDHSVTPFDAAYVTSCDVPFLNPQFVQELLRQIENYDIVVPVDEKYMHPLSAVYRIEVALHMQRLVAEGERRPRALFEVVRTHRIPTTILASIDEGLLTLSNLNSPSEYADALDKADLPHPNWLKVASQGGRSIEPEQRQS